MLEDEKGVEFKIKKFRDKKIIEGIRVQYNDAREFYKSLPMDYREKLALIEDEGGSFIYPKSFGGMRIEPGCLMILEGDSIKTIEPDYINAHLEELLD